MDEIRALTVKQPWAHFIAKQGKTVENRPWATEYRGLLAVHAGAYSGWDKGAESDPAALETWKRWAGISGTGAARTPLTRGEAFGFFTFGAVIAVADLTGCHHATWCERLDPERRWCSPWARPDGFHWELANVRRLGLASALHCRGKLGLWCLPEDVEAAVRAQLGAES